MIRRAKYLTFQGYYSALFMAYLINSRVAKTPVHPSIFQGVVPYHPRQQSKSFCSVKCREGSSPKLSCIDYLLKLGRGKVIETLAILKVYGLFCYCIREIRL